jgi:hypothetical protein
LIKSKMRMVISELCLRSTSHKTLLVGMATPYAAAASPQSAVLDATGSKQPTVAGAKDGRQPAVAGVPAWGCSGSVHKPGECNSPQDNPAQVNPEEWIVLRSATSDGEIGDASSHEMSMSFDTKSEAEAFQKLWYETDDQRQALHVCKRSALATREPTHEQHRLCMTSRLQPADTDMHDAIKADYVKRAMQQEGSALRGMRQRRDAVEEQVRAEVNKRHGMPEDYGEHPSTRVGPAVAGLVHSHPSDEELTELIESPTGVGVEEYIRKRSRRIAKEDSLASSI